MFFSILAVANAACCGLDLITGHTYLALWSGATSLLCFHIATQQEDIE